MSVSYRSAANVFVKLLAGFSAMSVSGFCRSSTERAEMEDASTSGLNRAKPLNLKFEGHF